MVLTVTLASVVIAVCSANATWSFVFLKRRASKRRPAGSVWREVASEWGIGLRLALLFLFYGEWLLVKSAAGSSSAAAWVVTDIMAAIFAWAIWDCGVWVTTLVRRARRPGRLTS
jgi:hypothetical protein